MLRCAYPGCGAPAAVVVLQGENSYARCDWHPSLLETLPGTVVVPVDRTAGPASRFGANLRALGLAAEIDGEVEVVECDRWVIFSVDGEDETWFYNGVNDRGVIGWTTEPSDAVWLRSREEAEQVIEVCALAQAEPIELDSIL